MANQWAAPPENFRYLLFDRVNPGKTEARFYYLAWQSTLFDAGAVSGPCLRPQRGRAARADLPLLLAGGGLAHHPPPHSHPPAAWVPSAAPRLPRGVRVFANAHVALSRYHSTKGLPLL